MARTILALGLLVLLIAFIRGAEDDERIRFVYNLEFDLHSNWNFFLPFLFCIFFSSRFRSRLRVRPGDRTEDLRDQRQLNNRFAHNFSIFYMFAKKDRTRIVCVKKTFYCTFIEIVFAQEPEFVVLKSYDPEI